MIDLNTGEIYLLKNDITINKYLKKADLQKSRIYADFLKRAWDVKTGYIWYYFKPLDLFGSQFSMSLCFFGEDIFKVSFSIYDKEYPTSWSEWSLEGELDRKSAHDVTLKKMFNRLPDEDHGMPMPICKYVFNWGSVTSGYDSRSGGSSIWVNWNKVL